MGSHAVRRLAVRWGAPAGAAVVPAALVLLLAPGAAPGVPVTSAFLVADLVAAAAAAGVGLTVSFTSRVPEVTPVATVMYGLVVVPIASTTPTGSVAGHVLSLAAAAVLGVLVIASLDREGFRWSAVRCGLAAAAAAHLAGLAVGGAAEELVRSLGVAMVLAVVLVRLCEDGDRRRGDRECVRTEAVEANAERDHEIRNILGGLAGASPLISGATLGISPEERDAVRCAFDGEVSRLRGLLDRQSRPGLPSRAVLEPIDVVSTVREVATLWGLNGRVDIRTDLPVVFAHCAPAALKQAVTNCLANCARHAPGSHVQISTRAVGRRVRVEVVDEGPGVDRTVRYSGGTSRTRHPADPEAGGHGIGMQATARLLGHYGGTLVLRPAPGGGALAEIEMPGVPAQQTVGTRAS